MHSRSPLGDTIWLTANATQPARRTNLAVGYAAAPFGVVCWSSPGSRACRVVSFRSRSTGPVARLPRRCSGSWPMVPTGRSGPSRLFFSRVGHGTVIPHRAASGRSARSACGRCWYRRKPSPNEQDRRHAYKLVGPPSPGKDYSGEVVLTPNPAGGTDIRWTGSFVEGVRGTGPLMRAALGGAVRFFAGRLVQAAERESSG